jgi:hypothetical protein
MLLGKVDLSEKSNLEFGLEIQGTLEKATSIRFVIEGPEFEVSCICKEDNGNVTAHIPKLKGILPAGIYETRLEIIVDGKIFIPLKESIELNPLLEFDVTRPSLKKVKEGVKVTVKKPVVVEDTYTSKHDKMIQKAISEGYELTKINEFDVLKKDNKYFGIVSDSKIIMSKVGHPSLSSLVEELSK